MAIRDEGDAAGNGGGAVGNRGGGVGIDAGGGGRGGVAFRVHPETLRDYAATVRGQSSVLTDVGRAIGVITMQRDWFGKLPQSGNLADGYEAHQEAELAGIRELSNALLEVATSLVATAGRYTGVDAAAADALGTVRMPATTGVTGDAAGARAGAAGTRAGAAGTTGIAEAIR
jgi:hypothetical protein